MKIPPIEKLQSVDIDDSSIALLVSSDGHLTPERCHAIKTSLREAIPGLRIPILIIDRGLRVEVLKSTAAKSIQEAIGDY